MIYAGLHYSFSSDSNRIFAASYDCGATWGIPAGAPLGGQARSMAFASGNPAALYASIIVNASGAHRVVRYLSGTWDYSLSFEDGSYVVASAPTDSCTAYAGGIFGVVRQNVTCGALSWAVVGTTLSGSVNALVAHPTVAGRLLAGTGDGRIYRKADAGSAWVSVLAGAGAINSIVYQAGNPLVVFAAGASSVLYKSTDGGASWTATFPIGAVAALAASAAGPTALYAGGNSFVRQPTHLDAVEPSQFYDHAGGRHTDAPRLGGGGRGHGLQRQDWHEPGRGSGGGHRRDGDDDPGPRPARHAVLCRRLGPQWFYRERELKRGGTHSDAASIRSDIDGDGASDVLVYRPSAGSWYSRNSASSYVVGAGSWNFQWGGLADTPIQGDFDGDGKLDPTVFRAATGQWFVLYSTRAYNPAQFGYFEWAGPGDIPVTADFDGDGKTDIAVYRPTNGYWYLRLSSADYVVGAGNWVFQWGAVGDEPKVGDFDGDGKADITVYRPSNGQWFTRYSALNYDVSQFGYFEWGAGGDVALTADFDGDGQADIAIYRPTGYWYIRNSSQGYVIGAGNAIFGWGAVGDVPKLADFDGDG